ncbi:MAG: T9SS type A sorting domain-containing protein [Bacteroidia bacterium]
MKHIYIFLLLGFSFTVQAQSAVFAKEPQWKFWVAFEDSSGQRDTVYLALDSSATTGRDTLLGEQTISVDTSATAKFQVYSFYGNDPVKANTVRTNYFGVVTDVFSYGGKPPFIVRWDTNLFRSQAIPFVIHEAKMRNDYILNTNFGNRYDMRMSDSIVLPPYFKWHFPIEIALFEFASGIQKTAVNKVEVYPNPFNDQLHVKIPTAPYSLILIHASDGKVTKCSFKEIQSEIIIDELRYLVPGLYILRVQLADGSFSYQKILKTTSE